MNLFNPVVPTTQFHQNFRNLMQAGNGFVLDVLNDWAKGFVDRDGKFVTEFQTTFNSSFWELYLYAVLKKYGMTVDFTRTRPDFCLPTEGFNIEATVALNAKDSPPEHDRQGKTPPTDLNAFNRQSIIRLSNSLAAKCDKYRKSYALLDHVSNNPFVIAATQFDQPFSFLACQRPIEAVLHGYYVDEERYIASGGYDGRLEGEALQKVFKDNGSPIELGLFTTFAHCEISAVIFSSCATMGKVRALSSDPSEGILFNALRLNLASTQPHIIRAPKQRYEENLLDGLRVYHNPYATHPLNPAIFRHPSVFQSYFECGDWVYEQREGQLLSRSVIISIQK